MADYQPSLSLTWKYNSTTGLLQIKATVSVDVPASYADKILVTQLPPWEDEYFVRLSLEGSQQSPIVTYMDYMTLPTGLTEPGVRQYLSRLHMPFVTIQFVVNGTIAGEITGQCSQNSGLEITT